MRDGAVMPRWRVMVGVGLVLAVGLGVVGWAEETGFFPLGGGTKRVYRLEKKETFTIDGPTGKQTFPLQSKGDGVEEVKGTDAATAGVPATVVETKNTETNSRGDTHTATVTAYYAAKPDGIYLVGNRASGAEGAGGTLQKYVPPLLWVKLPLQAGANWDVGKVRTEGIEMATSAQAVAMEDMTVPAGTYRGCWKIVYRHSQLSGALSLPGAKATVDRGEGTTTVWLAPGVGPVKEVTELTGAYTIRPEGQAGVEIKAEVSGSKTRELTRVDGVRP